MGLITFFVPALAGRHVDGGALGALRRHPPRQRASLVASFPYLDACVRASVAAGAPPSHHGILFEADGLLPPELDLLQRARAATGLALRSATIRDLSELEAARTGFDGLLRLEFPGLRQALIDHGPGSPAEQDALDTLDALLDALLRENPSTALVHGSAARLPVTARLDATDLLGGEERRVRAEEGVAWVEGGAERPDPTWRDRVLGREGVARILVGRALELHLAPTDRGWAVVCEPGWSFGAGRTRTAAVDPGHGEAPVVLGWGSEEIGWPAAVHDHRLGPTLARAVGGPVETAFDRPLPL